MTVKCSFSSGSTFLVKHGAPTTTTLLEATNKEDLSARMGRLFVVNLEGKFYSCKHCRTHLALYDDIVSKLGNASHVAPYRILHLMPFLDVKRISMVLFNASMGKLISSRRLTSELGIESARTCVGRYALGIAWASTCGREKGEWSARHYILTLMVLLDLKHLTLYGRANVFVGEKEERRMITGLHVVADIFCVGCGSIVGWKYETAHEKSQKYKEGKSVLERFKLSGPDGSHYWANPEHHHIGGSDADDV
ncbi:hypothetical protein DKX38_012466 [Salix brachista]|uniref:Yippee domain-containing protein n=1 Tax=Salix brachista TaxID=2182728 RepID=A0A5N5LNH9_9ROSI|nr:hypothetical protein DKX38_012466 [Salix brachista]